MFTCCSRSSCGSGKSTAYGRFCSVNDEKYNQHPTFLHSSQFNRSFPSFHHLHRVVVELTTFLLLSSRAFVGANDLFGHRLNVYRSSMKEFYLCYWHNRFSKKPRLMDLQNSQSRAHQQYGDWIQNWWAMTKDDQGQDDQGNYCWFQKNHPLFAFGNEGVERSRLDKRLNHLRQLRDIEIHKPLCHPLTTCSPLISLLQLRLFFFISVIFWACTGQ